MLLEIYPRGLRKIFTNRVSELSYLEYLKKELIAGRPFNLAIMGLRRTGKSVLIKEFMLRNERVRDVGMVYMNIQLMTTNVYDFAIRYLGSVNYWVFGGDREYRDYLTKSALLTKPPEIEEIKDHLQEVYNELEKSRPNKAHILDLTFSYPELLSRSINKKLIIFLDEFQDIIALNKQRGVGNILNIFRDQFTRDNTAYVLAGSLISVIEDIISNSRSPLFAQAEKMYFKFFTSAETKELTDKLLRIENPRIHWQIYKYSSGHPFYVHHILKRMRMLHELQNLEIDENLVKEAFIIETLSKEGKIYDLCNYIYMTSLERGRYYTALKSILNILAKEDALNQSQIARRLRVSQGASKEYLNELEELDLVIVDEHRYYFRDPVFRYWISYTQVGMEVDELPRKKDLFLLIKELDEKFQRASSELGKAKEYEFKAKLEGKFGINLENYLSEDGTIEFDLIGRKSKLWYIFEVKWRNRPATYKDLKKFLGNVKSSEFSKKPKKLFFISKSFTEKALKFARENDISVLEE